MLIVPTLCTERDDLIFTFLLLMEAGILVLQEGPTNSKLQYGLDGVIVVALGLLIVDHRAKIVPQVANASIWLIISTRRCVLYQRRLPQK